MAKFLVTSGSYYKPYTYDEVVKPLREMADAQNEAAEAYDKLSMETASLDNYIKPGDIRARQMYNDYMGKLQSLQTDLWENGYNASTRRGLSVAREGFANDISRLGTAIKNRQERSKEYWDARHKNPDLIMGSDPATGSLDNYLADDLYGMNYYAYSGNKFAAELGAEVKARAAEMLRLGAVQKDPMLKAYFTRIEKQGFTNKEVDDAYNAVVGLIGNNPSSINNLVAEKQFLNLDPATRTLATSFLSHLQATGAAGNVSLDEFRRLMPYGKVGLAQGIGESKYKDYTDHEAVARINARYSGSGSKKQKEDSLSETELLKKILRYPSETNVVTGIEAKKTSEKMKALNPTPTTLIIDKKTGEKITNSVDAAKAVYQQAKRLERIAELGGIDYGMDPTTGITQGLAKKSNLTGTITRPQDGEKVKIWYAPYKKVTIGKDTYTGAIMYELPGGKEQADPTLTKKYHEYSNELKDNIEDYRKNQPEIYKLAKELNPDAQHELYKYGKLDFATTPLEEAYGTVMNRVENAERQVTKSVLAQQGSDRGKIIELMNGPLESSFTFSQEKSGNKLKYKVDEMPNARKYDGTAYGLHWINSDGSLQEKTISNPGEALIFDPETRRITNVRKYYVTPSSIYRFLVNENGEKYPDSYVGSDVGMKNDLSIGYKMFRDDAIRGAILSTFYELDQRIQDKYLGEIDPVEMDSDPDLNLICNSLNVMLDEYLNDSITETYSGTKSKTK